MNLNYKQQLPANFHEASRVWVYQASRMLSIGEALETEDMLNDFVANWQTHGDPVKGYANLFFGQFVVMMADESAAGVSGCSTDSSVRVIKEMEGRFNVQLFDRQMLAFVIKDKIQLLPLSQLNYAVENNFINEETLYFNNIVLNKKELENNWIIPVKESWLAKRLSLQQSK
jgi:hypothetical protein